MENGMIADLHCDLLSYLQNDPTRTPYDMEARCSIPQLQAGKVFLQTLAVFTETVPDSSRKGWEQVIIFEGLPSLTGGQVQFLDETNILGELDLQKLYVVPAIENLSALCSERENLDQGFARLELLDATICKLLYLSLTWNQENRFGGGSLTNIGLKPDGKECLHFINGKNIALDLSHASDKLAFESLEFIDAKKLDIPILASHSNCRSVNDVVRNLPDELVQEIFNRKGLIGFNFYCPFVGGNSGDFLLCHIERLLELGGEDAISFGADFFYGEDIQLAFKGSSEGLYYEGLDTSACYPHLIEKITSSFGSKIAEKISCKNVLDYLERKSSETTKTI